MEEEDEVKVLEFEAPPYWRFLVLVDGKPRDQVFGPRDKRNWVLWKLSQIVVALLGVPNVEVKQMINGQWSPCDDWRKLAH